MKNLKYFIASLTVLAMLFLVAGFHQMLYTLAPGFIFGLGAMIQGGEITEKNYEDNLSEFLERDVDEMVVEYKPDRFPLTTMMQNQQSAKGMAARKYEWPEVGYYSRSTAAVGATAAGTANTAVTVTVTDVNMWGVGDVVYIPTVTVNTPAEEFVGYVQAINTTNATIDIYPLNATNFITPAIPDTTVLYRSNRAAAASDATTTPHGASGVMPWNYAQTFIGQFEIEKILQYIKTYMDDHTVQEDLEMYDFRNGRENARLFGARAKIYDTVKKKDVYTMGGIETFAGQATTYTAGAISESDWIDMTELIFSSNAGSEERLVVAGKKFISSVLKVPSVQKYVQNVQTELILGVKVQRVSTTYGDLLIKHHKGFNEMGRENDAFCLDMNYIRDRILEPMQIQELDLDTTGVAYVDATRIRESATLQVQYPDTHTIIKAA